MKMIRKLRLGLVLVPLLAGAAMPASGPSEKASLISIPNVPGVEARLKPLGLDVLAAWKDRIYVVDGDADLRSLERAELEFHAEAEVAASAALSAGGGLNGAYHSYKELEADLLALQQKNPAIAKVFDLGDSLERRHIYGLKISDNVEREENQAQVLILGCHHAREWISVEVPFLFGKHLVESYATDPEVKRLVDRSEIWIIPLVNPDGLEYTIHTYRYWRKNRRDNGGEQFGVDLNRNYDYKWGVDNIGSSGDPASGVYRGPAPFSEPETRAVRDLFLKKSFRSMVSYHSFSQVILYPWGYTNLPSDREAEMRDIAGEMASRIKAVNGRAYAPGQSGKDLYLTNGDTTDWTFGLSGIPSYTIELPPIDEIFGGFFNREEDIAPIFRENLPALLYLVDRTVQNFRPYLQNPFDLRDILFPAARSARVRH
jgi:carboxypeptidase T